MEELKPASIGLLSVICDRVKREKVLAMLEGKKTFFSLALLGKGTANSHILNYLGLGQEEKSMILTVMPLDLAKQTLDVLDEKFVFGKPGHGAAFIAPIYEGCYHKFVRLAGEGGKIVETKNSNEVILVVLDRGYTEEVMDAARSAGATGGTVLHARGCGLAGAEKFFGITIQPEKEMIFILTKAESACAIMQAIADTNGPGTQANAVSFSMPASDVRGIELDVPKTIL